MAQDVAELSNEAKAVELVHKAAYRTGLGNSVFAPTHMVSRIFFFHLSSCHSVTPHTGSKVFLIEKASKA